MPLLVLAQKGHVGFLDTHSCQLHQKQKLKGIKNKKNNPTKHVFRDMTTSDEYHVFSLILLKSTIAVSQQESSAPMSK